MEYSGMLHKKCFSSILPANIAKLLAVPPYNVKSFVGFRLIANEVRQVAIKFIEL